MSTKRFLIKIQILWRNTKRRFYKKLDGPTDVLTEKQKIGLGIFITGLNDEKNIRFLSSDDGTPDKKYIVSKDFFMNNDVETFITFINYSMTVVNHTWSYDIDFPKKTGDEMNKMFQRAVRRDRSKMERTVNKNVTNSLTLILQNFQKRQIENAKFVSDNEKISSNQKIINIQ